MDADPDPAPDSDPVEVHGFDQRGAGSTAVDPTASLTLDDLVEVAASTLRGEGVERGRLDLVLVDVDEMAELNHAHMGKAGPTDVLSFPLDGPESAPITEIHLGDVVLCPTVAVAQAPEHCGDLDAELTLLVVHGVLHVLGHDHAEADETIKMMARERHHLARYGLPHPGPVPPGDAP